MRNGSTAPEIRWRIWSSSRAAAVRLGGGSLRRLAAEQLQQRRDAETWTKILEEGRGPLPDELVLELAAGTRVDGNVFSDDRHYGKLEPLPGSCVA